MVLDQISDLTVSGGMPPGRGHIRKNLLYPGGTDFLTEYQTNKPHTMTTDQDPVFLTHKQLANRWGVSGMFLHRMRREGRLQAYRLGLSCIRYKFTEILTIESALKTGIAGE